LKLVSRALFMKYGALEVLANVLKIHSKDPNCTEEVCWSMMNVSCRGKQTNLNELKTKTKMNKNKNE